MAGAMAHCRADSAVDEFPLPDHGIEFRVLSDFLVLVFGGHAGDFGDNLLIGRFDGSMHAGDVPLTYHDNAVGYREHIRQIVADHHHGPAFGAQSLDICEHFRRLHHRQCGGRFVQQNKLRVIEQRACYGHGLALADG